LTDVAAKPVGQAAGLAQRLVDAMAFAEGWWAPGQAPHGLAEALEALTEPLEFGGAGMIRLLYFPTRAGEVQAFLAVLVFALGLARFSGYLGPVAWLSFPSSLLGEAQLESLGRLQPDLERLGLPASPAGELVGFDDRAARSSAVHVGFSRPAAWEALITDEFAVAHGLPLICIPSRSVQAMTFVRAPWS
jgi:hypothetical protein